MDDWVFISLAKAKADLAVRERHGLMGKPVQALTKRDTAAALDEATDHPAVRVAVALGVGLLINVLFFLSVERTALDARAPGQVVVTDLESPSPRYATAALNE
jgi:hypothetical protein